MRIPLRQSIKVRRHIPGEVVDGYETEESWSEPEEIRSCAVAPGDMVEPFEANREGSSVAYTVYCTEPGVRVGKRDQVLVPGETEWLDTAGGSSVWVNPYVGREVGVVIKAGRFDG